MKCPNPKCGAALDADAVFCGSCGERVAPSGQADATPMEPGAQGTKMWEPQGSAVALEPGSVFAKRYDIERLVGSGGMGSVYLARDQNTQERVALKLLHRDLFRGPNALARLAAEGVTTRQIRHPNIVAVYDVAQDNGQPYMSMEFVAGGSLRAWLGNAIRTKTEVPVATATGIIKAILAGLAEAHRMGVIHRDLKPENVLLQGDPMAANFGLKILDFGIAKVTTQAGTGSQSSTGRALGTPLYMAPEQHTAPDTVGPPADLYSVSVILYELLMETPPQGNSEPPSQSRKDVPTALDEVIACGMKQRPRDRFQSADEYGKALDAAVAPLHESGSNWDTPLPGGGGQGGHRPLPGGGDDSPKPEEKTLPPKHDPIIKVPASSRKKLYWGIGVAVLFVGGLVNNIYERREPTVPPKTNSPAPKESEPKLDEPRVPVVPNPAAFNPTEYWTTYFGGQVYKYDVERNGTTFTLLEPGGNFSARGILNGYNCSFKYSIKDLRIKEGNANCDVVNEKHIRYTLLGLPNGPASGCFYVDHQPDSGC